MDKRVYGVLGISSIMSNWNADFSGYPKTISDGTVFGSDKALKYPMKKMWYEQGKDVIYIKSLIVAKVKNEKTKILEDQPIPRTLKEQYEKTFNISLDKQIDKTEVLKNLFKAIDIKNFGATFAEGGNNISITGAVQIGQGFNKYEDSNAEEQQILSPFRIGTENKTEYKKKNDKEAQQSTLGTKIISDEAHYFYPFAINPKAYKPYIELGVTDGYKEKDYEEFKKTALVAATSFSTNAKIGCENEFGLFIETDEDLYLPTLAHYINFIKGDEKNTIEIKLGDLLNKLNDRIKSIEIYFNPYTTIIKDDIKNKKLFNIFTKDSLDKIGE